MTLRIDGMYEEALDQFNASLRLNPSNAAMIYNHRARVYQYQNQLELAADEIEKGLTLEPRQPLLRISLGYQQMRTGDLPKRHRNPGSRHPRRDSLRIVFPTIALCYVQLGDREKAASFIVDETLSAAEADSEMAYRLATYFAVEGDESEALHWLRRAIYLGNENYPWFIKKPRMAQAQRPRRLRAHPGRPQEELPAQPEELEAPAGPGQRLIVDYLSACTSLPTQAAFPYHEEPAFAVACFPFPNKKGVILSEAQSAQSKDLHFAVACFSSPNKKVSS